MLGDGRMDGDIFIKIIISVLVIALVTSMFVGMERVTGEEKGCQGMLGKYDSEGDYYIEPVEYGSTVGIYVLDTGIDESRQHYWYKCPDGTYIVPDQPNTEHIPDRIMANQSNKTVQNWV